MILVNLTGAMAFNKVEWERGFTQPTQKIWEKGSVVVVVMKT